MAQSSHIAIVHSHVIQASKLEIAPRCNGHHDKKLKCLLGKLQRSNQEIYIYIKLRKQENYGIAQTPLRACHIAILLWATKSLPVLLIVSCKHIEISSIN